MGGRDVVPTVAQGRADALTALPHGGIGKSNRVKVIFGGLNAGDINLDFNDAGIDAVDGGAHGLEEHGELRSIEVPCRKWNHGVKANALNGSDCVNNNVFKSCTMFTLTRVPH